VKEKFNELETNKQRNRAEILETYLES